MISLACTFNTSSLASGCVGVMAFALNALTVGTPSYACPCASFVCVPSSRAAQRRATDDPRLHSLATFQLFCACARARGCRPPVRIQHAPSCSSRVAISPHPAFAPLPSAPSSTLRDSVYVTLPRGARASGRLREECQLKSDRSRRATEGWRFVAFFLVFASCLFLQKNAWRGACVRPAVRLTTRAPVS